MTVITSLPCKSFFPSEKTLLSVIPWLKVKDGVEGNIDLDSNRKKRKEKEVYTVYIED